MFKDVKEVWEIVNVTRRQVFIDRDSEKSKHISIIFLSLTTLPLDEDHLPIVFGCGSCIDRYIK